MKVCLPCCAEDPGRYNPTSGQLPPGGHRTPSIVQAQAGRNSNKYNSSAWRTTIVGWSVWRH